MKKRLLLRWLQCRAAMLVTLLGASLGLNAEDKFYIPDFEITAGETKQIAIQYESDNVENYCGFQFDLYIPEGLTVVKKKNKYNFTFNTDRNDDHTMSSADQSDGAIRVVGISMTSAQFWESSGDFIYFSVTAAENFSGSAMIELKNVSFSTISGVLVNLPNSQTNIKGGSTDVAVAGITLDKTTAELTEGETLTLTATVTPEDATDKTVTWTSSDETVATVKDGVVTALKAGKVTITAKAGDVSATCELTVNAKVIPATGIALDKTTAELTEGETLTLTATVTPEDATDKTVTWTSSDETVATVKDGVVTALKAGKATITAKAGEVSATCELTVNAKVIPATGIALDKTTAELTEGETLTLTATVTPEDATDKTVTWTSSDETVATVVDGVVTALKAGKATITAKAGDVSATCELTVNAKVIPATGIALDKTTAELTEGETLTLTATVTPEDATDKTVIWTSSDETVATVANGVVTALKAGKAAITAKAGEVSATCDITVNAKVIPATGIALDNTTAELTEGETLTLTATVTPEDATDKTVVWTSSDETVATVKDGVVTALKAGKATITAKAGDVSATCEITVNAKVIPATGIALDKTTAEMTEGETLTLTATVTPEDATDKTVVWTSSDETVATVANGVVTALKAGKATITAKAGDVSATCEITVNAKVIPATGIALDKTTAEMTEGETLTLTATVTPEDATDKTVVWTSSDETVATVKDGVVTALKAGKATITAKAGEVSATCELTVNAKVIPATGIALDKTTAVLTEGETLTLTATVTPEDATDKTVTWTSSDETVATVANGVVTALKAGKATITAKAGEVSATCEITVNAKIIPATGITLDKTTAELTEGETLTLTATVTPEDATDKTVTWTSSDETVATVKDGVVTALKAGKATITAKIGEVSATCEITVNAAVVEPIYKNFTSDMVLLTTADNIASLASENWMRGGESSTTKTGTIDPATGETVSKYNGGGIMLKKGNSGKMFETYVSGVAKVTAYGCTTGGSDRTLIITATSTSGETVTAKATSSNYTSVAVELSLDKAKSYKIEYTGVTAEDESAGSDMVLHGVKFSVNETILATGIALDKTTAELTEGETLTLTATVTPEDATDKTVTWTSSDETVATVKDGVVTALKAGKVTITAKAGDVSATCEITVNAKVIPATGIALDKTTAELTEGETLTLTATVTPEDATDKTVVWTSSDETVATVKDGVVTALKAGKATITAKAGDVSASCELTVNAKVVPATGIALDKTTAELTEGETLTLTATVTPEDATDKTVTWTSSDETVATVKDGVVTALKAGKATITAKTGEVSATCELTVNAKVIPATNITLDKTTAELTEGETLTLTATVTPEDATDKTVTWTSSDETVATVKDGVVTALKAGKVTITAKAGEVSATCEITVVPATGIDSITTEEKIASGNVYTINGVKVLQAGEPLDKLSKGLYIINGKKVVVK